MTTIFDLYNPNVTFPLTCTVFLVDQEAFMRGTEKYAHETNLSKRVGAWQEKLEPLMRR